MNANYGNFNPAQYVREDNTLSRIGDRFANAAASIPGLIREGEKWQDERNKRDSNENLKAHLYDRMQKLNAAARGKFGGDAFNIPAPERGESIENYTMRVGSVMDGALKKNPQLVNLVWSLVPELGNSENAQDAHANSLLQGAEGNAQTAQQGGVGFMGGTLPQNLGQEQVPQLPNRFEQGVHPDDGLGETHEQAMANHLLGDGISGDTILANKQAAENPGKPWKISDPSVFQEAAPQSAPSDYSPLTPQAGQTAAAGGQVPVGGQGTADRFEASRQKYVSHLQGVIDRLNGKDGMDGEIQVLEKQLASLENGGMRFSPRTKDIRDQLKEKRTELNTAIDKIHDANKPEKVDYSANEEKRKQGKYLYDINKPYYNPNPSTLQFGSDFYRALQNNEQKDDNLAALQAQKRALQEKIGKTEDPTVKSRLKQQMDELQTRISYAEGQQLTAEKLVNETDRSGVYRNVNKPQRVNRMKNEAKTIINSQITNRLSGQVFGSKRGAPELSEAEMSRINTAVKTSANKMGLDEEETQVFIAEVNRLFGSIITGKPIK
jgi:hypothetical protein